MTSHGLRLGCTLVLVSSAFSTGCAGASGDSALLVHHASKAFVSAADRAGCGGDYDVTTWVRADSPSATSIHVREVTFSARSSRDMAYASALEIGDGSKPSYRLTDMIVRSDARSTFVTFPVNRTFDAASVRLRHTVVPAGVAERCALTVAATINGTAGEP